MSIILLCFCPSKMFGFYHILKDLLAVSMLWLCPYVDEIIGDHQCGFRRNRSTTDQIFCIRQVLEKELGIQ
jgi:hypothetical protein